MTVKELIAKLSNLPPYLDVRIVYDGEARMEVNKVWVSRDNRVMLCDNAEPIYSTNIRPNYVPTEEEEPYLYTTHIKP